MSFPKVDLPDVIVALCEQGELRLASDLARRCTPHARPGVAARLDAAHLMEPEEELSEDDGVPGDEPQPEPPGQPLEEALEAPRLRR